MPDPASSIRLTETVKKGGCAAKVAALELRRILAQVRFPPSPPELLVDGHLFDDAAVYRVSDDCAIVQTLDFFTPIVNSPRDFGRIAAANAISDVYAMGGRPVTALAILAFPLGELPNEVVADVMNGACDVLRQAGAALAGGHSIDDDTLKFGLSVTGLVHPDQIWTNSGARPGDALILTKPLGTGALAAALKRGEISDDEMRPAIESMAQLNDAGVDLRPGDVHAATDVTGFGLAGHAMQMALASDVGISIRFRQLPRFPGVGDLLARGFVTKAHRTNAEYVGSRLREQESTLTDSDRLLLFDPQTSGGLLLAVPPQRASEIVRRLQVRFQEAAIIGSVSSDSESGTLTV